MVKSSKQALVGLEVLAEVKGFLVVFLSFSIRGPLMVIRTCVSNGKDPFFHFPFY